MEDQLRRNDQDSLISCRQFCLDGAFIKQGGAEPGFPLVNANFLWISFIFKLRKHPSRVRARIRIYIKKCATALCRSADENKSEIRASQNFTFDMKPKTTKQRRFYPSAVLYVSTNTVPKNSLSGSYLCAVVEARGIEPLSENHLPRLSPSAADRLRFPSTGAERQAPGYGSRLLHDRDGGASLCTFTAKSRLYPGRGIPGRDGSLIRPRAQQCCCRLF